jgi:hypothetical protein
MPIIDPRNAPGTVIHAAASKILGKCTARAHLGNTNYCLTFLQGVIIRSSNGKEGGAKPTQWKLNVNFSIPNQEGAEIVLKNFNILQMHCFHEPVLALKNQTYMSIMDSIQGLDHLVVNRATNDSVNVGTMATADATPCTPQGNMATIAAAVAHVSLLLVVVLLSAAHGNGEEIKVCPTVAANTASDTADTAVAMSKRQKVIDAALLSSPAALKKSKTTKGKEPPINLYQISTYAVTNNCMKYHIHAITHGRKWVAGNARMITRSVAPKLLSDH